MMTDQTLTSLQNELKKSEKRFRTFFEYAPDAIYISDETGIFIDGNRAAEKLVGYKKEELIGKNYFDLEILSLDQMPKALALLEKNAAGLPTGPDEFTLFSQNKTKHIVEICTYPLQLDRKHCILGITRDITDRKQAEIKLKKAHDDLEIKVKERTLDLEEANTALRVLLKKRTHDRETLEQQVLFNINQLVMPTVAKLKKTELTGRQKDFVAMLEMNLSDITSPLLRNLTLAHLNLTVTEKKIAPLIKVGKSSSEISSLLNMGKKTVDFHRENIRRKCNIKNKKINLRTFLQSLT